MADALNKETIAELSKLGRMSIAVQTAKEGGIPFAIIPNECKLQDLAFLLFNEHNERPERRRGTAKVLDPESFCEYYRLFSDPDSRVFADETKSAILSVLDYHEALEGKPRWGQHRLELTLRHSEEWTTWMAADGKKMPQMEFAEFVEDNMPDIVDPSAATMLEVARDLSAKTDVDFGSVIRMQNGSVQFKYSEQVKGTFGSGNLEVPERFSIAVPVHVSGPRVTVVARLRYRINSGKLTFWFDLHRADQVERDAFQAVRVHVADTLAVAVINGSPA